MVVATKTRLSNEADEINLYVRVNKTVSLKVKRSETIENLRVLLGHQEGVSEDLQLLEFNGKEICDRSGSVTHCGIQNNSTISLREISRKKLYFKFPSNKKTIERHVTSNDTFSSIQSGIMKTEGILLSQYSLYYAGKLIKDFMTVASLNIQGAEATIQLIPNPIDEKVLFSVETPAKNTIQVEVKCMHTVLDLKKIVESTTGFLSDDWDLFHGRARLQNVKTLASYDIQNNDQLKMMPAKFRLMVRIRTGKVVTLLVTQMDTICIVKEKVFQKTDVPVNRQQLVLAEAFLKMTRALHFTALRPISQSRIPPGEQ